MQLLRNAGLTLGTGFILFFCSERLFWTVFKPTDSVGDLIITWLAYSTIAYWFLAFSQWFKVRSSKAAILVGACYGWITEGMLVGTLYGTESSAPFPQSIICTGLSWHALISVGIGWYAIQKCMRDRRPGGLLAWAVLLGIFWGVWATFLWKENPPIKVRVEVFGIHAFAMGFLFFATHNLVRRLEPRRFQAGPLGLLITGGILLTFYGQQIKKLGLLPLILLPTLLGITLWALSRTRPMGQLRRLNIAPDEEWELHRSPENDHQLLKSTNPALILLAIPCIATAVYFALLHASGWEKIPIAMIVMYWVTAPIGALIFTWAFCASIKVSN